jgi:hypothetical protein
MQCHAQGSQKEVKELINRGECCWTDWVAIVPCQVCPSWMDPGVLVAWEWQHMETGTN